MKYRVIVDGRLPSLNEYIDASRRNRYAAATMKRECMERVLLACSQTLRGVRITPPVYMRYLWIEPNKKRDKDNVCAYGRKIIQDALVVGGYLPNDGWRDIVGFEDAFLDDAKNPRVIVEIEEVRDGCV